MIDLFTLDKVNRGPASLDVGKLFAVQDRYMQRLPVEQKVAMTLPYLQKAGLPADAAKVTAIVKAAGDRIKVAGDILDYRDFFVANDQVAFDEKVFEQRLRKPPEAAGLLRKYRDVLAAATVFDTAALDAGMNAFVTAEGIKLGQIVHAVRVAVTGKGVGFGLFDVLAILGKQHCLARIDRTLARL